MSVLLEWLLCFHVLLSLEDGKDLWKNVTYQGSVLVVTSCLFMDISLLCFCS